MGGAGARSGAIGRAIPLLLLAASAVIAEPSGSPKSHAGTISGTVASVDDEKKTLVVRDAQSRESRIVWTGATHVTGGVLKVGEKVTVRWMPRDGKKVATAVQIQAPAETTTAAASVSPTPKSR